MNNDLKSFINDYFELTGRPISTMTVKEYCTFCEKEIPSQNYKNSEETRSNATINSKNPISDTLNPTVKKETNIQKSCELVETSKNLEEKQNKPNILKLLQSVNG